jgi:hypothetical protein
VGRLIHGVRAALAVLPLVAIPGCRERAQAVQHESELMQVVRQMTPAVERATGLKFKRPPVIARRSRTQVRDYVIHKFDADLSPAELAGVQAAYRLFGLIPDSLDLRRTMIDLLTEQVAGYYDPDSGALYIPTDIDPFQVRIVISHELVHALQDQYMPLDSVIEQKHQNDRRTAAQAVLEGQATLAQILVLMPEQKVESLPDFWQMRDVVGRQQAQMQAFARAPLWLRESLIFPYLGGAEFVRWYGRTHPGQQPFGKAMPTSTEQILHPDRYAAGDQPTALAFDDVGRSPGDSVESEDGLGEFETRLLFSQLLGNEAQGAALAQGWDGDRYRLLATPAGAVLVWYSVWDDDRAAARFFSGLQRAWARRRSAGPPDRRYTIERLTLNGIPAVRLVDAPKRWAGWSTIPLVNVGR